MKRGLSTGDIASATQDTVDDNDRNHVYTQVRGRRKKVKKVNEKVTAQTGSETSATINSPLQSAPSTRSTSITAVTDSDGLSQLQKTVEQLSSVMHAQQATIDSLTRTN